MQAEESAAVIGWTLETFGTPFVNWLKDKAQKEKWKHFDWPKAEQAYLDKVIDLYDRVRILGNSMDVPLGNIFTQVYILDKPTARQRYDIEELRKQGHERSHFQRQSGNRIHGMQLAKNRQNLFILGKPGAGKTTFLKYITIQAARKQLSQIPIFVSLNQWTDSKWGKGENAALLPFIVEQFDICDFPEADLFIDYLLRKGQALLLFDGLDEVKQENAQRRRLTHLLQDFARQYNQSKYLITCRSAANEYAFERFVDVEIADFTEEQVQEYVRNWFGAQEKNFTAFVDELAKRVNQGLAELCKTPLLLSLLCLTFDNDMRFPPSRAELYEDALETLLRKWDSNRQIQRDKIYCALSHKRKLQLLMSIALPAFQKNELFFQQRDLAQSIVAYLATLPGAPPTDTLDGTEILKAMEAQHSILVERAQGIYSFSHLAFQEYLTARALAESQGNRATEQVIYDHLTDPRWREVFLLTASLLTDADGFIHTLRQATAALLASTPTLIQLLGWAQTRTSQAKTPDEQHAAVHLAYVFLTIEITLAFDSDLDSDSECSLSFALLLTLDQYPSLWFAHSLASDLARVLALASTRANDPALALTLALASHSAKALTFGRTRERVRALALATTPLVGFDYGLYYAWAYATLFADEKLTQTDRAWQRARYALPSLVQDVAALAQEGGHTSLAQKLLELALPTPNSSGLDWQQYADAIFAILRTERDLGHDWNFSDKEIDTLNDYFYANELLVQCLQVATVSDRQAVLNSLLLPPEVKG